MNYKIVDRTNPRECEEYEAFVSNHENGDFMQSLSWLKVKENWKGDALIVKDDSGKVTGAALILIKKYFFLPKAILYTPHGPVCDYRDEETMRTILEGVRELSKKYKACTFRMDPCVEETDRETINRFLNMGFWFQENPIEQATFQLRHNYVLDIKGRSAEELLANFHTKWRYNIRVAERKGVECIIGDESNLDDFYRLMKATGDRDVFAIRSKEYFRRMIREFGDHCRLYMCYKDGVALSGAITIQYARKTYYVYGASSNEARNLMPNHLMQWVMIQWAVEGKNDLYNFLGIPHFQDENHPDYGVYRFKKGFNGRVMSFAGEFDYPFSKFFTKLLRGLFNLYLRRYKKVRKATLRSTTKKPEKESE